MLNTCHLSIFPVIINESEKGMNNCISIDQIRHRKQQMRIDWQRVMEQVNDKWLKHLPLSPSFLSHYINDTMLYWCCVYIWGSLCIHSAWCWILHVLLENIQLCLDLRKIFIISTTRKQGCLNVLSMWYNFTKTYDVCIWKHSRQRKFLTIPNVAEPFCLFLIVFHPVNPA